MPRWILLPFALVPPAIVLLIYAVATVGTTDSLGRVPVPGERTLALDAGKVTLHYEESRNLEEGSGTPVVDDADFLEIPADLDVGVREVGGPRVEVEPIGSGNVAETEGKVAKAFAHMEVPRGRRVPRRRPADRPPGAEAVRDARAGRVGAVPAVGDRRGDRLRRRPARRRRGPDQLPALSCSPTQSSSVCQRS